MITLRECRPEDYEAVAAIATLTRPEPFTAQELMEEDRHARGAGTLHRLVAADEQGRVVGYACAEYMPWSTPGCWDLYAVTHPDHRGRGNGTALYQAVEQIAREGGATALSGWCRSTDPAWSTGSAPAACAWSPTRARSPRRSWPASTRSSA